VASAAAYSLGFVLVAGFFLITEHQAHAFQYLPYLLVLACPLTHFLHRHRVGRHDDAPKEDRRR
jgi:hypothetical protein